MAAKSYFYAYGKTVIGGIGREVVNRYNRDGNFYGGGQVLLSAAAFMMISTMLGLELRQLFKWFIQAILPGVDSLARSEQDIWTLGSTPLKYLIARVFLARCL